MNNTTDGTDENTCIAIWICLSL